MQLVPSRDESGDKEQVRLSDSAAYANKEIIAVVAVVRTKKEENDECNEKLTAKQSDSSKRTYVNQRHEATYTDDSLRCSIVPTNSVQSKHVIVFSSEKQIEEKTERSSFWNAKSLG